MRDVKCKGFLSPGSGRVAGLGFGGRLGCAVGYLCMGFRKKALRGTLGKLEDTDSVGSRLRSKWGEFWSIGGAMEKGVCKMAKTA